MDNLGNKKGFRRRWPGGALIHVIFEGYAHNIKNTVIYFVMRVKRERKKGGDAYTYINRPSSKAEGIYDVQRDERKKMCRRKKKSINY
jgi:hypothetical protein